MKYETILIDLDDTLLDFSKAEQKALEKTLLHYVGKVEEETIQLYKEINTQLWKKLDEGDLTRQELYRSRFTLLFKELGIKKDGIKANREYLDSIEGIWIKGAKEVCETLSKICDIYIVTNGETKTQYRKMKQMGLEEYINKAFISQEIGYAKPSKEYFLYVFSKIEKIDLSKTLLVGDRLSSDIIGGNAVGIDTCWYNKTHKPSQQEIIPTYEIEDLEELFNIIK